MRAWTGGTSEKTPNASPSFIRLQSALELYQEQYLGRSGLARPLQIVEAKREPQVAVNP